MKKISLFLVMALVAFVACEKEKGQKKVGETNSQSIDAAASNVWQYFSFANGIVDSGKEDQTNNAKWAKRTDWDIAISKYLIRTNSGTSSSVNAKGGVYTFDEKTIFASVNEVPANAKFVVDKIVTSTGMGGSTTSISHSTAQVIQFKTDSDGNLIMPPVYLPSPVYLFKTADGNTQYKVYFTQYKNDKGTSGHVKFDYAEVK